MNATRSLLDVPPGMVPELDPDFRPAVLAHRSYRSAVARAGGSERLRLALERDHGLIARRDLEILPVSAGHVADTWRYVERIVKFLLWSRGGWRLHIAGPEGIIRRLRAEYASDGPRRLDVDLVARRAFGHPFEVVACGPDEVPEERGLASRLGGHLDGCRIGFDLGASDYKLAAVIDGEPVFSTEIPWDPSQQSDPAYHYAKITEGLKLAASHLPRVDAIGGSSAGIYIDNQVRVASLFRSLSPEDFEAHARPLFLRIRDEWGVPLEVANDGDVTALAGAMSLGENAMLGVAMGSSEAAGYLDREGCITGWLNELAFAPVDMNPASPPDEWSKDHGVGAMHFSQQAVNKLAVAAGISFPPEMHLAERLREVQGRVESSEALARSIFTTIGTYLGYTIPYYAEFYDYSHLLVLGRVTSGAGGELLVDRARGVLRTEFPETAEKITLHVPDERSRRVGQAVAAASLPELG